WSGRVGCRSCTGQRKEWGSVTGVLQALLREGLKDPDFFPRTPSILPLSAADPCTMMEKTAEEVPMSTGDVQAQDRPAPPVTDPLLLPDPLDGLEDDVPDLEELLPKV